MAGSRYLWVNIDTYFLKAGAESLRLMARRRAQDLPRGGRAIRAGERLHKTLTVGS